MARLDDRIKFTTITCEGCGGTRVLENACGDCGRSPRPGEVNSPVVTRRQSMRVVEELIASRSADRFDFDLAEADQELRRLVNAETAALADVLGGSGTLAASERLADAELGLRAIAETLQEAAVVRPSARPRAYLSVARELQRLWPLYLEAATTSDVGRAEQLAARAQTVLDGSTRHLSDFATDVSAAELLANVRREPDLVTRVFEALRRKYPRLDLGDLIAHGRAQYRKLSGLESASGSSVDFLTIRLIASAYLDPDALDAKLRELALLPIDKQRLRAIAQMTDSIEDFGVARRDLFEALTQFERMASTEADPATIARRLAKTVGELYEAAVPLFAWCQLIVGDADGANAYQRLAVKDSTDLTKQLARSLPRTFQDLPSFLRNAGHHGRAFEVHSDTETVEIRLRSHAETMTISAYVNLAYAMLESLLAVHWTISNWLEHAAIGVPMPSGAVEAMGLTQAALAAFWLREAKGVSVDQSTLADGRWTIVGEFEEQDVLTVAIAMAQLADVRCEVVEVRQSGSMATPISIALEDYTAFSAMAGTTGAQSALALLELRHRATRDDRCLLGTSDIEFAVVALGFAVAKGELDQVPNLRRARQFAVRHGESDLSTLAARALATVRNGDDFALKVELATRTKSFLQPEIPVAPVVEVRLRSASASPRTCD